MPKKTYTLAIAHPMRESFANIVSNLDGFSIDVKTRGNIHSNENTWKSVPMFQSFEKCMDVEQFKKRSALARVQRLLGLVNIRRFETEADVTLANGGFLITNKPYVVQIEKATQPFGYTAQSFRSPIGRWMLRNRLADPMLRSVVFMTETAMIGFRNTFRSDAEIVHLINKKGTWCYPSANNPQTPSLKRFQTLSTISFLFISASFILKGGRELIRVFDRLCETDTKAVLTIITHMGTIDPESLTRIRANKRIRLVRADLDRNTLFRKYLNKAHCFIYPTYSDSFSMTVNEAIAAYLPIITSDFFSIPERVKDGINGYCFSSPFKNYDAGFVIQEEHFGDRPDINRAIYTAGTRGTLESVEAFLYKHMFAITRTPSILKKLANGSKRIYETRTSDPLQRQKMGNILREAARFSQRETRSVLKALKSPGTNLNKVEKTSTG